MRLFWSESGVVVHTPAKVNLSLWVLGRRPDGYHELDTVMTPVGIWDSLELRPTAEPTIQLTVQGETGEAPVPQDNRNLVMRAAHLLREETGCTRGVAACLHKRIPTEAGLGGGSSDAAAALVGLNQLWNLGLDSRRIHAFAAQLGSDVNVFLDSAPAVHCRGRGEIVTPIPLGRRLPVLIIKPLGGLSTAAVFGAWVARQAAAAAGPPLDCEVGSAGLVAALQQGDLSRIRDSAFNSLESVAVELHPGVELALSALRETVGHGCLSGSGSACFAVCLNQTTAVRAAAALRTRHIGRVFVTTTEV